MTTPEHDQTVPDAVPAPGPEQDVVAPVPPAHPDASVAATTRWESDGGHLHR